MWPFDVPVTPSEFKYLENQVNTLRNIDCFTKSEKRGECVFLRENGDVKFQLVKDPYGVYLYISHPRDSYPTGCSISEADAKRLIAYLTKQLKQLSK